MHSNIWIGQQFSPAAPDDLGLFTLVAILQEDVVVLRYETVASEPNWSGTEGYALCQVMFDGTLQGVGGEFYKVGL